MFADLVTFLSDPTNWSGPEGIPVRIVEHLYYSALAVAIATVIAVPIGMMIGHTHRGETFVVGLANGVRSLPSLGIMTFLVLVMGLGLLPPVLALVILGIPPLMAGTYAGVCNVDALAVDGARAMGMSEPQVLFRVELPNARPLILSGFRTAFLDVIATATIAAYVNLGGLGRYIFDGLAVYKYGEVAAGAIMVTATALLVDFVLMLLVKVSRPGLRLSHHRAKAIDALIAQANADQRGTQRDIREDVA